MNKLSDELEIDLVFPIGRPLGVEGLTTSLVAPILTEIDMNIGSEC